MNLETFLASANADPELALAEARLYSEPKGNMIEATTVNGLLSDLKLTGLIEDISNSPDHLARPVMKSILLGLKGNHPFNFIVGTAAGDRAINTINWVISTGLPEHGVVISQFKDLMMYLANGANFPFAEISLHAVLIARGICPVLEDCTPIAGYFVIDNLAACPRHSPNLWGKNSRTLRWNSIGRFPMVEGTGRYELPKPAGDYSAYRIDNAYGDITCLKTL